MKYITIVQILLLNYDKFPYFIYSYSLLSVWPTQSPIHPRHIQRHFHELLWQRNPMVMNRNCQYPTLVNNVVYHP